MAKNIHNAAGYGSTKEIRRFLKAGVEVDELDANGNTPLHLACRFCHVPIVELLLDEGASIDAGGQHGRRPLHAASTSGSAETVVLLLDRGADSEATDDDGWTPLMCAASRAMPSVCRTLIDHGVNLDAQDSDGATALVLAFDINSGPYSERFEVIELLLENGCDLSLTNSRGRTAVDVAIDIDRDHELIARLQEAAGLPVTAEQWDMVGGDDCVLCRKLTKWKPSKSHPDYISPDLIESWLGVSPPGRVKFGSGTMYRGKTLIKREAFDQWHREKCANAE